jgi:tRNA-2-methylthio-N6-dimethylallyladenosine synthase
LDKILKAGVIINNQKYVGRTEEVLVDGYKQGRAYGKTASYKIVSFSGSEKLIGQFVKVKIIGVKTFTLLGKLL